jgi:uncharacterized protein YhbP (UPF0306 family)
VQTAARILAFLDAHHVMSLATCGAQGPHAANVLYVRDGFALLWVSDPASRHSLHIQAEPRIAATIAPDCSEVDEICGVQISGRAQAITGEHERADAQALLERRYPSVRRLSGDQERARDLFATMQFYRLDPARMVLIDNSRGFGHKETLEVEGILNVRSGSVCSEASSAKLQ